MENKKKKKIKKTVIITGYKCNNQCRFCINEERRHLPVKTTLEIKKEIIESRERGSNYLELIGGETTIRPDIIELISLAKSIGFSTIMMSTNGRMYSYPDIAKSVLEAGLNSIVFSIHGNKPEIHDWLTQVPGSLEQLEEGVKNVKDFSKEMGIEISLGSNTTIVKQNYELLPEIGEHIRELGIGNSEFIFVDPSEGGANKRFDKFVPKISEVSEYIHKCLDIKKRDNLRHWHVRYVPLCYFTGYLDQISELHEVNTFSTEQIAPDFYDPKVEENRRLISRRKTEKCRGCELFDWCEGIWKEYLSRYGDRELTPIRELNDKQTKILSSYRKFST